MYGTSPGELTQSTPEAAAGVVSMNGPESETVTGLNPGTTYYYDAAADNATASTLASNVEQFTTQADAPSISNVSVDSVTDTAATIDFTVNPRAPTRVTGSSTGRMKATGSRRIPSTSAQRRAIGTCR